MNGGTCIEPGECSCATGWTGDGCETGMQYFIRECRIESTMITAVCEQGCNNGGTCTGPGMCMCTEGWEGDDCTRGNPLF